MNNEEVMQLMTDMGLHEGGMDDWVFDNAWVKFANAVAKHTLANIDPSSFMTWQEGYEAGKQTEREACAKLCEQDDSMRWAGAANAIRARGQA